jgi:uncharacterized protein
MQIALISDTHMPRGRRRLPPRCVELLRASDFIVHAGDLSELSVLAELEALGPPVHAVHGNVDTPELAERLPAQLELDVGSVRVAVLHDAGPAKGRLRRVRRRFPQAAAVVFGHSHIPLHAEEDGFQIFNPGSPTERRAGPHHTMGLAEVSRGEISFELIQLD